MQGVDESEPLVDKPQIDSSFRAEQPSSNPEPEQDGNARKVLNPWFFCNLI